MGVRELGNGLGNPLGLQRSGSGGNAASRIAEILTLPVSNETKVDDLIYRNLSSGSLHSVPFRMAPSGPLPTGLDPATYSVTLPSITSDAFGPYGKAASNSLHYTEIHDTHCVSKVTENRFCVAGKVMDFNPLTGAVSVVRDFGVMESCDFDYEDNLVVVHSLLSAVDGLRATIRKYKVSDGSLLWEVTHSIYVSNNGSYVTNTAPCVRVLKNGNIVMLVPVSTENVGSNVCRLWCSSNGTGVSSGLVYAGAATPYHNSTNSYGLVFWPNSKTGNYGVIFRTIDSNWIPQQVAVLFNQNHQLLSTVVTGGVSRTCLSLYCSVSDNDRVVSVQISAADRSQLCIAFYDPGSPVGTYNVTLPSAGAFTNNVTQRQASFTYDSATQFMFLTVSTDAVNPSNGSTGFQTCLIKLRPTGQLLSVEQIAPGSTTLYRGGLISPTSGLVCLGLFPNGDTTPSSILAFRNFPTGDYVLHGVAKSAGGPGPVVVQTYGIVDFSGVQPIQSRNFLSAGGSKLVSIGTSGFIVS